MSDRIKLTRKGYEKLHQELKERQTTKRREIAKDLEKARAFGDLKENAEYDSAKNAQAMNEALIAKLNEQLSRAEILDEEGIDKDKFLLGATATLKDLDHDDEFQYMLVAAEEADFKENKISTTSPIGKALLGHKVNDEVVIQVPAGTLRYKILKIER
jgi:transcription elongation factor GreA